MAAVAPISSTWIPEDDLLLKNAVEAGASLEALAKGAVQFSRRFTFRELRDRWHSLLYDPDISAQASARMIELELSGSHPPSKFYRSDNSKTNHDVSEKRKIGSIHKQYYAMRKRIRSELLDSTDLGFLAEPNLHDCSGQRVHYQEHATLDNEPRDGNCMLGDCTQNHFVLQETDFDILHHAFPEALRDIAATTAVGNAGNAFHTGWPNPVEDNHPNRIVRKDCLYGFHDDVSSSIRNDGTGSFEPTSEQIGIPHTLEDNSVNFGKCLVEEISPSQGLPDRKIFKTDDSEMTKLSTFDSVSDDPQNVCSGIGGRQHLNSPDSDGSASFHRMGFSSPLHRLPLWKTMEDISAPTMHANVIPGDRTQGAEKTSALPADDSKKNSPSHFGVVCSGPLLRDGHNGAGFINSTTVSEGEIADLSDTILNFPNEDALLFMDVDGKDTIDKSCYDNLNSLLLNSPNDVQEDDVRNLDTKSTIVSNTCLTTSSGECPPVSCGDQKSVCHSEVNVPSTSVLNSNSLELTDDNTCCTLNTEDPEIPCNDDIFLLIHPTPSFTSCTTQLVTIDYTDLASSTANQKDSGQGLSLMKKGKDPAQSFTRSHMVGPKILPEMRGHPVGACGIKSELALLPGDVNNAIKDPSQCRLVHETSSTATDRLKEDVTKDELRAVDPLPIFREVPLQAEASSTKMTLPESVGNPSISDQEEYGSDNEVPYFSDIEAMILEMDLGPYDQDSYLSKQVSRYQCEDTKRTIIRLEQCARSSLQRAMSSQEALAIFYGHHLKHYIKKTKVILGRSTDDIDVDIDLRKEGRANKISRRQAIIKMETNGSFVLKNLGKSSVSVNGKEVANGQLLTLSSSCLIEIRGMSFVFEINHKYVRNYLDSVAKKCQGKISKFDWSPEEEA